MKKRFFEPLLSILLLALLFSHTACGQEKAGSPTRLVIIRHGEKPGNGDNLSCAGLNRALALPGVLVPKFGVPDYTYVAAADLGKSTSSIRMLQTVTPLAVKYNLTLNTKYDGKDVAALAKDIQKRKGTILLVWEHNGIEKLAKELGVQEAHLKWPDDDYDSIWVITLSDKNATLQKEKENIHPAASCQ